MEAVSNGMADLDYCRTLTREVHATLDFLEANGVELIYFKQAFPNRNTGGGLGMPAKGGVGIVDGLAAVVDETPGSRIFYETEAVRLSLTDGRIDGVIVRGRDGILKKVTARAVVIACGGFEGSKEMLTQYLGARACDMPLVAPTLANNTGDGLRMAMEVGAGTAGQFDMFHGEPVGPALGQARRGGLRLSLRHRGQRATPSGSSTKARTASIPPSRNFPSRSGRTRTRPRSSSATRRRSRSKPVEAIILTDRDRRRSRRYARRACRSSWVSIRKRLETTVAEYNAAITPGPLRPVHPRRQSDTPGLTVPKSNWAFRIERPPSSPIR